MGMGFLTVKSRIYKFGVFSNKGILILLKINGPISVNSRQLLSIFMKNIGMVLYCLPMCQLHYIPRAKLCYALIAPGWIVGHSPNVNVLPAFQHEINTFLFNILRSTGCQPVGRTTKQ